MYRVLIVEDEIPVRNTIIESVDWQNIGLEVAYAAGDGQEALEWLEDNQVDLILTDIYMPFIDGLELIRRVRKTNNYCKVVFLTGYNEFDYAKEAIDLEASKYLLKPITKDELTDVLVEMKDELDKAIVAMKNLNRLEKEYERSLTFLRDKLLYDIIAGFMPSDRIEQACENLGCDFDAGCYRIGVLEVVGKEEVGKKVWEDDYSLLHFAMYNICREILADHDKAWVLLGERGKIIMVFTSEENKGFGEIAYNQLAEVLNSIRRIYDMPMTAGLSDGYTDLKDLKVAYEEALSAIEYAVLEGDNRVIVKSDIEPASGMNHQMLEEYMEQIVSAIKVNEQERITKYLSLYIDHIKFQKYDLNEVKTLLLSLLTKVYDAYNQICVQASMKQILDFRLVEQIYALDNLEVIEMSLISVFTDLSVKLKQSREDDKHQLVIEAVSYIEKEYADPSIDLGFMSDMLHVSTSHFSRSFKAAKNQTFVEYLTAYRMEKAKEMLRTTDKKVYEIATETGYDDAHYFSYNFRKNVGMTPLQYRKA